MRMQPIFISLALLAFVFLGYNFTIGLRFHYGKADLDRRSGSGQVISEPEREAHGNLIGRHFVWGISSGVFACFVHSLVLVYFLGTGKAIKEQIELRNWDSSEHDVSKKLMAKAVLPTVCGILLVIMMAFSGGFTLIAALPPGGHLAIALAGLLGHIPVFARQLILIRENGRLMDRVLDRIDQSGVTIAL